MKILRSAALTMTEEKLPFHDHPLSNVYFDEPCDFGCKNKKSGFGYNCKECDIWVHKICIERSLSLSSPCKHPLKIYDASRSSQRDIDVTPCHFCNRSISRGHYFRCWICNINVCKRCMEDSPPLTIYEPKNHEHMLTVLPRALRFVCNACGEEGVANPYVCVECNVMLHKDCAYLPRVICINRHDHRISRTSYLGYGKWQCGVCRQEINYAYGAFSCARCPSYAVHSRCATRKDVWDGIELEDVLEEEEEIEDPFIVINENEIIHFSHEKHHLRLDEEYVTENDHMRCNACVLPINDDPFYKCVEVECDFCLHETCANLPRKKRHVLHNHKLILRVDHQGQDSKFLCTACGQVSNGFRYECYDKNTCSGKVCLDLRCGSISEPFDHTLHKHLLYRTRTAGALCQGCLRYSCDVLSCIVCENYALGMECATLPRKVKHRCDDHFLALRQGAENARGDLWCDICEEKTDPSVVYYTCDECGVTLHTNCVLGDLFYTKLGHMDPTCEVLPNNGMCRRVCDFCGERCKFPFLLKRTMEEAVNYFCSLKCLSTLEEINDRLRNNDRRSIMLAYALPW